MFDLYGLPSDFPDLSANQQARTADDKVNKAEASIQDSLASTVNVAKFIPYVQKHEYKALVLASLDNLKTVLDAAADLRGIETVRSEVGDRSPKDVNDGAETAPSKRLSRHIPGYDKVLHGELAVTGVFISELAKRCPHFGAWVAHLEAIGVPKGGPWPNASPRTRLGSTSRPMSLVTGHPRPV